MQLHGDYVLLGLGRNGADSCLHEHLLLLLEVVGWILPHCLQVLGEELLLAVDLALAIDGKLPPCFFPALHLFYFTN